jgi:hypothetical protein
VIDVWEAQFPVVTVVSVGIPSGPTTLKTSTVSEKISKLRPKAKGDKLK